VTPGDAVQTPLGKGVVREVRNNGRLLVELKGRAVEIAAASVSALEASPQPKARTGKGRGSAAEERGTQTVPGALARSARGEVDLHGLTVEEALARAEDALNEALLADSPELRLVHGRSGGRIRAALHRRLQQITSVRSFRLDPRNAGVTIVVL
jgi:DNA mismatch repair protein MutS2